MALKLFPQLKAVETAEDPLLAALKYQWQVISLIYRLCRI